MTNALQLIAVSAVPPQAWRNGGGATRELLAWPSAEHWQCRISVADIAEDGPFSAYPGVDRWFAVAQGAGVVLRVGHERHVLDTDSAPLHFDGGVAPGCSLQGGATRDLNLMARRDAGRSTMQRVHATDEWFSTAPLRALFTTEPLTLQIDDADAARVPAWTLAVSTHGGRQRWRAVADSDTPLAWWMDFAPGASA